MSVWGELPQRRLKVDPDGTVRPEFSNIIHYIMEFAVALVVAVASATKPAGGPPSATSARCRRWVASPASHGPAPAAPAAAAPAPAAPAPAAPAAAAPAPAAPAPAAPAPAAAAPAAPAPAPAAPAPAVVLDMDVALGLELVSAAAEEEPANWSPR